VEEWGKKESVTIGEERDSFQGYQEERKKKGGRKKSKGNLKEQNTLVSTRSKKSQKKVVQIGAG